MTSCSINCRWSYVEAVITTNMDVLLEVAAARRSISTTSLCSDDDFATGSTPAGSLLIAHLHGSCVSPSTMRGSWTDTRRGLPPAKVVTVTNLIGRYITVFVGYAALNPDIVPLLLHQSSGSRIFWVIPASAPSKEIRAILAAHQSEENFISSTGEEFFSQLHDALFPVDSTGLP